MGFKENLKDELKYQGILVKELADKCNIPKGTIDHYLAEKCTEPIAENAVKIAKALNVSVEYLVTGNDSSVPGLYTKYSDMIKKFDSLSDREKSAISKMITNLSSTQ